MTTASRPDPFRQIASAVEARMNVGLDPSAKADLEQMVEQAMPRMEERSFSEFNNGINSLSAALPEHLMQVRAEEGTPEHEPISAPQLHKAMLRICPIWPIC